MRQPQPLPPRPDRPDRPRGDWAGALRTLYGDVVDEPLPASFIALLAALEERGR